MPDFVFVPRSISKRGISTTQSARTYRGEVESHREPLTLPSLPSPVVTPQVKPKFTSDDIVTLLRLCLSRHSCWCDIELLRIMKESGEGYVPIQYLLDHVSTVSELETKPTELEIVHDLRSAEVEHEFDIRMIIHEPHGNEWLRSDIDDTHTAGMFEIRRKDYEKFIRSLDEHSNVSKDYWDMRTVYIERFPTAYRTKHAISQHVYQLLVNAKHGPRKGSKDDYPIQAIIFPPHYSNQTEKGLPRYKGFAFIILDSCFSVEKLCDAYPWNPVDLARVALLEAHRPKDEHGRHKHNSSHLKAKAIKFGTRMLPKAKWDELRNEYLEYQKKILTLNRKANQGNGFELTGASPMDALEQETPALARNQAKISQVPPSWRPNMQFTPARTYPENCLVFVKNVHPETNKTTLRQLFASTLSSPASLDYVDFTKGIDSCHLRLSHALEATRLVSSFNLEHRSPTKAQLSALDNQGGTPTAERPAIIAELVQGKREELYWAKVPQNLREKALNAARQHHISSTSEGLEAPLKCGEGNDIANKAKRKKR